MIYCFNCGNPAKFEGIPKEKTLDYGYFCYSCMIEQKEKKDFKKFRKI
jgi:hypothetical protein